PRSQPLAIRGNARTRGMPFRFFALPAQVLDLFLGGQVVNVEIKGSIGFFLSGSYPGERDALVGEDRPAAFRRKRHERQALVWHRLRGSTRVGVEHWAERDRPDVKDLAGGGVQPAQIRPPALPCPRLVDEIGAASQGAYRHWIARHLKAARAEAGDGP